MQNACEVDFGLSETTRRNMAAKAHCPGIFIEDVGVSSMSLLLVIGRESLRCRKRAIWFRPQVEKVDRRQSVPLPHLSRTFTLSGSTLPPPYRSFHVL